MASEPAVLRNNNGLDEREPHGFGIEAMSGLHVLYGDGDVAISHAQKLVDPQQSHPFGFACGPSRVIGFDHGDIGLASDGSYPHTNNPDEREHPERSVGGAVTTRSETHEETPLR